MAVLRLPGQGFQEMAAQGLDVPGPLPQGGQVDGDGPQPEQQVLAESPAGHHLFQVPVGGRHHPEIALLLPRAAHGTETAFLEHAQKGLLDLQGQFAHLVQEQDAAVGLLDEPHMTLVRRGEGPLLVAEEHAFHQVSGQGRTVHHHEGAVPAGTVLVDGPGEKLLARAGLAGDQDVGGAFGRPGDHVQAGPQGLAAADDGVAPQSSGGRVALRAWYSTARDTGRRILFMVGGLVM